VGHGLLRSNDLWGIPEFQRERLIGRGRAGTTDASKSDGRADDVNIANVLASKGAAVVTIHPDQTIRDALELFAQRNIGALVVVDSARRAVGMITERGILRSALTNDRILAATVGAVMTREVVIGHPSDDLMSVAHTMTEKRIRHLPVIDQGQLVGIVSLGDLVRAQRDHYEGQVVTLESRLSD
jgi:CBS domain-containing protein